MQKKSGYKNRFPVIETNIHAGKLSSHDNLKNSLTDLNVKSEIDMAGNLVNEKKSMYKWYYERSLT